MNSILFIFTILLTFLLLITFNKIFGKQGLYFWLVIALVLTNILDIKTITILDYDIPITIIFYISVFTCTNIIIQKYGPEQTKKILTITLTCIITLFIIIPLLINLNNNFSFNSNELFNNLFKLDIRKNIAFTIAYIASILANIELYYQIRKTKNKIWLSNLICVIIIFFTDTMLYSLIAYIDTLGISTFIMTNIITTFIKYLIGLIGTIAIYTCNQIQD